MHYYKPDRNICDYHNDIIDYAKDLVKLKSSQYESIDEVVDYINSIASNIETLAQYALEAGNNMEDRLFEYKNSIESLGFTRNKK